MKPPEMVPMWPGQQAGIRALDDADLAERELRRALELLESREALVGMAVVLERHEDQVLVHSRSFQGGCPTLRAVGKRA